MTPHVGIIICLRHGPLFAGCALQISSALALAHISNRRYDSTATGKRYAMRPAESLTLKDCAMRNPALSTLVSLIALNGMVLAADSKPHDKHHHKQIAFTIRSVTSGSWSEAKTWQPARLPKDGDRVLIARDTRVVYDVSSEARIRLVQVVGTLSFSRDCNTLLNVGVLKVQNSNVCSESGFACDFHDVNAAGEPTAAPDGHMPVLEVGTIDNPIPAEHTARIRLHFFEGMDRNDAPAIACCSARMDFHGTPMSRTWVDLGTKVSPGDSTVLLSEDVTGWRVGDEVIVTGTHRTIYDHGVPRDNPKAVSTESRQIKGIEGRTLTLDRPLEHEHYGSGDYRSEVANLSRNVVIESADPDGVRGHTMYHAFSRGGISYARFAHLGKEGVLGRYSIHFHLVGNTMRGSSVRGAAIVDSHNRWITIHGTNHLVVRDCVGYQSVGHGFFLEDGTEVYNVLDRNLGVQAYGGKALPEQVLSFDPNDGAAFWWANGRNTFTRNSACENNRYGFRYDSQKRSNFDSTLSVMMPDGKEKNVDIRTIPFYRFENNETHTEGLYGIVIAGTDLVSPDKQHPHILKNLSIWNVWYGLRPQVPKMLIENVRINYAAYGIYRAEHDYHVYRNVLLTGIRTRAIGFSGRADGHGRGGVQHGSYTHDNLTLENIHTRTQLICVSQTTPHPGVEAHFRNLVFNDAKSQNNIVNMSPGMARERLQKGVAFFFHDYPEKGKTTKVVSVDFPELMRDGQYQEIDGFTGSNVRARVMTDVDFPRLLDPIDDLPPATVVTDPPAGTVVRLKGDTLIVRGTTTDNVRTTRVVVNGTEATDVDYNFHQWEVKLTNVTPGPLTLRAFAEDAAGNVEQSAHELTVTLARDR